MYYVFYWIGSQRKNAKQDLRLCDKGKALALADDYEQRGYNAGILHAAFC